MNKTRQHIERVLDANQTEHPDTVRTLQRGDWPQDKVFPLDTQRGSIALLNLLRMQNEAIFALADALDEALKDK